MIVGQEWYERFIRTWQAASSSADVARHMGISPRLATFRASFLRKHGVQLKRFVSKRADVDWKALARMVAR